MFDDLFEKLKSKVQHLRGQGEVDEDDEEGEEDATGEYEVDPDELEEGASDDATQEIQESDLDDGESDEDDGEEDEDEDEDEESSQDKRSKLIKGFLVLAIVYLAVDTFIPSGDKKKKPSPQTQQQAKKAPTPAQAQGREETTGTPGQADQKLGEAPSAPSPGEGQPSSPMGDESQATASNDTQNEEQKRGGQGSEGPIQSPPQVGQKETKKTPEPAVTPQESTVQEKEGPEAPGEPTGEEKTGQATAMSEGEKEKKDEQTTQLDEAQTPSEESKVAMNDQSPSETETDVGEAEKKRTKEGKELEGAIENLVKEVEKEEQENLEYVDPPSYEVVGRGLVYNCKNGHWACVDRESYFTCRDNKDWSLQNNEKPECYPIAVYASEKDCKVVQLYNINTKAPTNFCSGESEPQVPGVPE